MKPSIALLLPMMLSVGACAQSGQGGDYCAIAKPIYMHPEDQLTRATEDAIISHSETWEKNCTKGSLLAF